MWPVEGEGIGDTAVVEWGGRHTSSGRCTGPIVRRSAQSWGRPGQCGGGGRSAEGPSPSSACTVQGGAAAGASAPQRLGGAGNGGDLGPVAWHGRQSGVFCDAFWE